MSENCCYIIVRKRFFKHRMILITRDFEVAQEYLAKLRKKAWVSTYVILHFAENIRTILMGDDYGI